MKKIWLLVYISLRSYLFFLILLVGLFSVPNNLSGQHKIVTTNYSNGKPKSRGSTFTYPVYRYNTVLKKKLYFGKIEKREKEWDYWYQNGQVERIENYKLVKDNDPGSLPDGLWSYFNYQGIRYREENYADGRLKSCNREIYCYSCLAGKISIKNGVADTSLLFPLTKQNNLIINPCFDFYYYKPVPVIYHGNDAIEAWVPFWTTPGNYTPDYISNNRFIDVLDYNSLFDSKLPEKFNYIGIALFKDDDDYSEYIQGKLTRPLIKGRKYCFKISINSTKFTKYLVNRLACNFSAAPIQVNNENEDTFSPQVSFSYLPTESKSFVTLCKQFSADGGEMYLTIGRFIKKEDLSVTVKDSFPDSRFNLDKSSYYLIEGAELDEIDDSSGCNCGTIIDKLPVHPPDSDSARLNRLKYFNPLQEGMSVVLNNIRFDFDSYILLESSEAELNTFYQFLTSNPDLRFRIDGHTDNIGTEEYNNNLSLKRAKSVYDWLVNKGIQASRMQYKGFGKSQPLIDSNDEKARSVNRRVEVKRMED